MWNWREMIVIFSANSVPASHGKPHLKDLPPRPAWQSPTQRTSTNEINRNFSYDCAAYDEGKRNLSRLVEWGNCPWRWNSPRS